MKIGVISESPLLTTGYGIAARHICQRLHEAGAEVTCLGIHQVVFGYHENPLPYRVWPTCPHDINGVELMEHFLQAERPDVLLLISTLQICNDWALLLRRKFKSQIPALIYFSAEGAPLSPDWFPVFRFIQGAVGFTRFTQQAALQAYNVKTDFVHLGVDHGTFHPYAEPLRRKIRQAVGWDDRFVVQYVGRNMFAKQQDKVVEAASLLKAEGCDDVLLYLHCKPFENYHNGGWDLPFLVRHWDVREFVCFPPDLRDQKYAPPHEQDLEGWTPTGDSTSNLASLRLAARYNAADLYIHPSMVEGFSLPCVEAMACGVPIAHTDDGGVMNEVCDQAGYRIPRVAETTVSWGSRYAVVAARDIAETIRHFRDLFRDDPQARLRLGSRGVDQAAAYDWGRTAKSLLGHLERAAACRV